MQADASDDVETMLLHEIVNGIDRAVGTVFDGQDAVVAKSFLDGLCDAFEVAEPRDVRQLEATSCGKAGIGAFRPLARDGGQAWQRLVEGGVPCRFQM